MLDSYSESLVSVIVPCYNASRYVLSCIKSIMEQDYKTLEIICVDDGSVDDTINILEELQAADSRLSVFRQDHQYAGTARNMGMRHAKGEYLLFLDSDDIFLPQMVSRMVKQAEKTQADMVLCDAYFWNCATGEYSMPSYVLNRKIVEDREIFAYKDICENIFQVALSVPWNKLFRRSFIQNSNIQFQCLKRSNDEYFSAMALMHAHRISWIPDRLVLYRTGNENSLQSFSGGDISDDFYKAHLAIKDKLFSENIYEEIKASFLKKICSACVAQLKKQGTYHQFDAMYRLIKETVIPSFFSKEDIKNINNKNMKMLINSSGSSEYLFLQVKMEKEIKEPFSFPFKNLKFGDRKLRFTEPVKRANHFIDK